MPSNNPVSLSLPSDGYIWPLDEDQDEETGSNCPMLLSPPLSEGTWNTMDQDEDTVCMDSRKRQESSVSLELYSIPEDWALDCYFTNSQQTAFLRTKSDERAFLDMKNSSPVCIGRMSNPTSCMHSL